MHYYCKQMHLNEAINWGTSAIKSIKYLNIHSNISIFKINKLMSILVMWDFVCVFISILKKSFISIIYLMVYAFFFSALLALRSLQINHFNLRRPCQKDKQLRVTEGCLTGGGYIIYFLVKYFWNCATAWSLFGFVPITKGRKNVFVKKKKKRTH